MTQTPTGVWRVGVHYKIHVYQQDRPVATFHDEADARWACAAVNLRAEAIQPAVEDLAVAMWCAATWLKPDWQPDGNPYPTYDDWLGLNVASERAVWVAAAESVLFTPKAQS